MPKTPKTLIIANPKSRNGESMAHIQTIFNYINHAYHPARQETAHMTTNEIELYLTKAAKDAVSRAAHAASYDTVVALGGDGIIHEVVNGLMRIRSKKARPKLGIIPVGSGNDYAKTLGIAPNDPEKSLREVLVGTTRTLDLGKARGEYFMETLSFGLDAAIAQDTMMRRKHTQKRDMQLYLESALDCFSQHHEGYPFTATLDDGTTLSGTSVIFACQVGQTYGGGFKVCPDANPCDGLLNLCCTVVSPSVPRALFLLGRARFGKHTKSPIVRMAAFKKLHVAFEDNSPGQIDGEIFEGTDLDVEVVPQALDVIVGQDFNARYPV